MSYDKGENKKKMKEEEPVSSIENRTQTIENIQYCA